MVFQCVSYSMNWTFEGSLRKIRKVSMIWVCDKDIPTWNIWNPVAKNSSRMIFQLYTGQSILFVDQLLWCKVQSWKEAVWSLLYECGRREEHRSDICWGFMGTQAHSPIFEGKLAVLRPFESCLC
jgi:hypothetical protein